MNEIDLERMEQQNREIKKAIGFDNQNETERRSGMIITAVVAVVFCIVLVVLFALGCATYLSKHGL